MPKLIIPENLINALISKSCILFAGSGLSAGIPRSNGKPLPTWEGLLKELLELTQISDANYQKIIQAIQEKEFQIAAHYIRQFAGNDRYYQALRHIFADPELKPGKNHRLLIKLPFKAVLTTNYDSLLEDIFKTSHPELVPLTHQDLPDCKHLLHHQNDEIFVVKLHGDIYEPETIILGSRDYQNIIYQNQAYQEFLNNLLLNYSFLFIGFGLSDDDLDQSLAFLNSIFSREVKNTKEYYHYALLPKGRMTNLKQDWFTTERGLKILEYKSDDTHSQVTAFFESLHSKISQTKQITGNKPIPPDSESIQQKLWQSSLAHYEKLTGPTGRFAHLIISDLILTQMKGKLLDTNVKLNCEPEELPLLKSLHTIWGQDYLHTVIVGAGGMGKTVSLIRLWNRLLKENNHVLTPIPLYLALNEYNNVPEEDHRNYLIKMIGRIYLDKWHLSPEDENIIRAFLKTPPNGGAHAQPRVILLLDGFNEVTADKTELLKALNEMTQFASGVQLVLTSRYDMRPAFNWQQFNCLELLELTDTQISTYLGSLPTPLPMPKGRLYHLIRNPMMLTLYAATSQIMQENQSNPIFEFKTPIQTTGELLWNFVECQLVKSMDTTTDKNLQFLIRYLFKHLLPYLGYQMEQAGKFYLSRIELESIVNQASERFSNPEYLDTYTCLADHEESLELGPLEAKNARKRFVKLKEKLCYELMMLVEETNQFRFLHQHFRDYFAAAHILNEIQVGLFQKQIPKILKEKPISFEVRRFMGEIEGEHNNKPKFQNGWSTEHYWITNLEKILNLCRDRFDDIGFAVWNIVEVWKECRGELTGANLSNLNLSGIGLNQICCSKLDLERYTVTNFENSLLNERNILPQGHSNYVTSAVYSEDGRRILSASWDNTIKEWSTETGECIRTYLGHSDSVRSAVYSEDGRKILSTSGDNTIKEWSTETRECIRTYLGHFDLVTSAVYSEDGRRILSASGDKTIKEWSTKTGECLHTIENISGLFIQGCSFKNLHRESKISNEAKAILKQYGAKFE